MRTKNFLNLMALVFERCSVTKGLLPCKAYDGTTYYITPSTFTNTSSFPYSAAQILTISSTQPGFCVGSGTTAATEDDYDLASQITSGLSASIVANPYLDDNNDPCVDFDLTITNTGSTPVTIAEIGYKQNITCAAAQGGTSSSNRVCLLDRTVLDEPVTIPASDYAVIRYTLKTDI